MSRGDALVMARRIEQAAAVYAKTVKFDPNRQHPILEARARFIDRPRGDYVAAIKKLDETANGGMIIQFLRGGRALSSPWVRELWVETSIGAISENLPVSGPGQKASCDEQAI
jgi:hypothetical protein